MASRYHLRLHGRALKINEEVVRGDGIYEEIEDPEDKKRRLKRGDFNEEEEASLANAPPGTEQYQIAQKLRHEAEINREFAQMYSGTLEQMRMRQQQQQQQSSLISHGQPFPQYQWCKQDLQSLQMQPQNQHHQFQQQQTQQKQRSFSGPSQVFGSPTLQQSPAVSVAGAYQHSSGPSSAVMTPQQYHLAVNANSNAISPQTMMAGLEAGLSNAAQYSLRSNSAPDEADATTGVFPGSDLAGPNEISTGPLLRHSFSSPHENGLFPGTPGLIMNSSATTNSTPSVSTSTSQDTENYVAVSHGNQVPVFLDSPITPNPVIRQDSDSSILPMWTGPGSTVPYAPSSTKETQLSPLSLAQPNNLAWGTTYSQHAPILSTADAQATVISGYPPTGATLENKLAYEQPASAVMPGSYPVATHNLAVASELMSRQLSSRICTPGGSAGDQWADWVQFSDEAI
ncbi:hypothetical protein SEPCBS119000_005716 [Sporothrix epigloea]|uniref:Uncharacterized protein n=1 Tax=Sporothrix epigloea TaxID=1892477 RepID=A0ABP0E084_9PEZI